MKKFDFARLLDHWPAKVLALGAALLLFLFNRFDSLQTRSFSIPVRMVADTTLVPAEEHASRVKVTLRGTDEVLSTLSEADIEAQVDFSSHQSEGQWRAPVQILRHGAALDAEALEIQVDPLEFNLRFEKRVVKTVPVTPNFVGQPGRNFELSGSRVTPSIITLEGPRSVVERLNSITTEPIELRGKTDTFTIRARVAQDTPLLSFPYGSTVEVQGLMTSSLATLVLENVVPTPINLNSSLHLQSPMPPLRVKLRGTSAALSALEASTPGTPLVVVTADLSGYGLPGEIPSLALKVILPEGVEVVSLEPATVSLFLEARP